MALFRSNTLGRNEPCHCGSGRKYKQCCLAKDEAAERAAREKAAEKAPPPEAAPAKTAPRAAPHSTQQPWKGALRNTRGFQKVRTPRKVGGS